MGAGDAELTTRSLSGDRAPSESRPSPSGAAQFAAGDRVARYRILREIGRGGMGVVYEASDETLGRRVALKLLPETSADPALASHLVSEARAAAGLSHPNVVSVYEVGLHESGPFLAMEHVDGVTARSWLDAEERSWRDVLRVFVQAGRGLAAAHDAGIVHGDVKPSNILVGADRTRIADFGLARGAPAPIEGALAVGSRPMGTPRYMAPEQQDGEAADVRSDQYSFCLSLYEALHGVLPGRDSGRSLRVPGWLRRAIRRGISADPTDRHPSMTSLLDELERPRGRARRIALGLGGFMAAGTAAFFLLATTDPPAPCQGAERKVAGLWDETVKEHIAQTFSAERASYAPAIWNQVAQVLDDYVDRWKVMHREACEATRVYGEQSEELLDRRMACLDHRLRSLDRFARSLPSADAGTLERTTRAARALPAIEDCGDRAALASAWAGQETPGKAKIREAITIAALRLAVGAHDEGLQLGEQAARAARAGGDLALEAEARLIVGRLQVQTRDTGAGIESLSRAVELAADAGAGKVQIDAWIALAEAYQSLGRMEEARRVLDLAETGLAKQPDRQREVRALQARGALAGRSGEFEEARRLFDKALQTQISISGAEAEQLVNLHIPLATALRRLDRFDEALGHVERAVAVSLPLGQDHPRVAEARYQRGIVLSAIGRHEEALEEHQQAAAILRRAYGERNALLSGVENSIAAALSRVGRMREAIEHFRASLAIKESLDADVAKTLLVRTNLASALIQIGEAGEAEPVVRGLLADRVKLVGDRHPDVGLSHRILGEALAQLGRFDEAFRELASSLSILREALGAEHVQVARTLQAMAEVQRARRRFPAARRLDQRAIGIFERALPADHPERVAADLKLARDHLGLGATGKAKKLAERALAFFETRDDPAQRGRARWILARVSWRSRRERDRALELARAARIDLERAGSATVAAEVGAWLEARAAKPTGAD